MTKGMDVEGGVYSAVALRPEEWECYYTLGQRAYIQMWRFVLKYIYML